MNYLSSLYISNDKLSFYKGMTLTVKTKAIFFIKNDDIILACWQMISNLYIVCPSQMTVKIKL